MSRLLATLALLLAFQASAEDYAVAYNPYSGVDWQSVLYVTTGLHEHANTSLEVTEMDDAGFGAMAFMHYCGYWDDSSGAFTGMGPPRQYPPSDFGAPALSSLTNIKAYIRGCEELGLRSTTTLTAHIFGLGMTEYIEGEGCDACGPSSEDVGPTSGVPSDRLYDSNQELIDLILALGGFPILAHPSIGDAKNATGWRAVEFNTYMQLRDEANYLGESDRIATVRDIWDTALDTRNTRIWGVGTGDQYGAFRAVNFDGDDEIKGGSGGQIPDPTDARHIGQWQTITLVDTITEPKVTDAVRNGVMFVCHEDNTVLTKGSCPDVAVEATSSRITVTAGGGTVSWYANPSTTGTMDTPVSGRSLGSGSSLNLSGLASDLTYVRFEVDDGSGTTVYSQPFSLRAPQPRPIGGFGRLSSPQ